MTQFDKFKNFYFEIESSKKHSDLTPSIRIES